MTMPWKVLVGALVAYVVTLTWAFAHMVEFLQRMHFNETVVAVDGLSSTAPGMQVSVTLAVVGGLALLVSLGAFILDARLREAPR